MIFDMVSSGVFVAVAGRDGGSVRNSSVQRARDQRDHAGSEPSLAAFARMPHGLRRALGRVSRRLPEGVRGRDLLRRGALPLEERYHGNARNFRPEELPALWRPFAPDRDARAVTGRVTKHALRAALRDVVPAHVVDRPKLGFPVPIRLWLRAAMYPWARDVIANSGAGGLVDLRATQALLDEHRGGTTDRSRQLWTLLVFLVWHRIAVEERSATPPGMRAAS